MKNNTPKIEISYFIESKNCLKKIVAGTRTFSKPSESVTFIRRLMALKNALCERSAGMKYGTIKKANSYSRWKMSGTMQFQLCYSAKHTHVTAES